MTIKKKVAYYTIPVILVCVSALFILKAHYLNKHQELSEVYRHPTTEEMKVVPKDIKKRAKQQREQTLTNTANKSDENAEVDGSVKAPATDTKVHDATLEAPATENNLANGEQQQNAMQLSNEAKTEADKAQRELPNLQELGLMRPHYTKVLDNGVVFDSRKSRVTIPSGGVVTSTSKEDLKKTIADLEKRLETNDSPLLRVYIDALKRGLNP